MSIDAVLFDLYDTLAASDWRRHIQLVGCRFGVSEAAVVTAYESLRDWRDQAAGDPRSVLVRVAARCGVEPEDVLIDELVVDEAAFLAEEVTLYDDSLAVLAELRRRGVRTAVVSNCSPSTRPVVDRLRLGEFADTVVLSCEVGFAKPHAAIFRHALRSLGVGPSDAVFVDDRRDYLDGARALGLGTFRIIRSHSHGEDAAGGDHTEITGLHDLLTAIPNPPGETPDAWHD